MPYPNQHAARLRDPDDFEADTMVTLTEQFPDGITAIAGKLTGEDSITLHAVRFDAEKWTAAEAREWMRDHPDLGEVILFEEASGEKEKADEPATPEPGSVADKGMASEVRDRYRHARLVVLTDEELVAAHDLVHQLFADREEGATTAGYSNAHLATLRVLAEREMEHPAPMEGTEALDEMTADAVLSKTLVVSKVWLSKADGRPDVVYMVVHVPFELDGQGDWFDDRDVLDMAHEWALNGFVLNLEHDKVPGLQLQPGEAQVVESATAPVTFIVNNQGVERAYLSPELFGDTEIPAAVLPHTRVDEEAGESLIPRTSWILAVKAKGRVLQWFAEGKLTGPSFQGPAAALYDNRSAALKQKYP